MEYTCNKGILFLVQLDATYRWNLLQDFHKIFDVKGSAAKDFAEKAYCVRNCSVCFFLFYLANALLCLSTISSIFYPISTFSPVLYPISRPCHEIFSCACSMGDVSISTVCVQKITRKISNIHNDFDIKSTCIVFYVNPFRYFRYTCYLHTTQTCVNTYLQLNYFWLSL